MLQLRVKTLKGKRIKINISFIILLVILLAVSPLLWITRNSRFFCAHSEPTFDTQEDNQTLDTQNVIPTIDTQNVIPTIDTQNVIPTIDTQNVIPTIDTQNVIPTIDTQNVIPTIDTQNVIPTIDTQNVIPTIDTQNVIPTIDTQNVIPTIDTQKVIPTIDTQKVISTFDTQEAEWLFDSDATAEWFPTGVNGDNETGYPYFIVPNIVHYVLIDVIEISFVHYISIKSVLDNHNPDQIMIHCNCDTLSGKYWSKLLSSTEIRENPNMLVVRKIAKPTTVYGMEYNQNYHRSDVLRIKILMEFGGIYLDRDIYVVKSLNEFRKFEMTVGFDDDNQCIGNQVQIAHKRARFLRLYLQTYQKYDGTQWYWNAGIYPMQRITSKFPHLTRLVRNAFGVTSFEVCDMLYKRNAHDWQSKYYTIHMLMRNADIQFTTSWCFRASSAPKLIYYDEHNIKNESTTFGQMARLVFYNTTRLILI